MISEKTCTKCSEIQPLANFRPNPKYAGGHATWCRECERAYFGEHARRTSERRNRLRRERRRANPERTKAERCRYYRLYLEKERQAMRSGRDRNRDWVNAYMREYRRCGPVHLSVREAARRIDVAEATIYGAIYRGKLTKVVRRGRAYCLAHEVESYQARARAGLGAKKWIRLDNTRFQDGTGTNHDAVADPGAISPEAYVVEDEGAAALMNWVESFLTEKQRLVLRTLVAHDYDDKAAARKLDLTPSEVRRYLACIQKRANKQHAGSTEDF